MCRKISNLLAGTSIGACAGRHLLHVSFFFGELSITVVSMATTTIKKMYRVQRVFIWAGEPTYEVSSNYSQKKFV